MHKSSVSADLSVATRVSALFLVVGVLGCVAPEEKNTGGGGNGNITQIAVAPSSVNFTSQFGTAPADKMVDISGSGGNVSGLGVGTILYSPIVSGWLSVSIGGAQSTPATMVLRVIPPSDLVPGTYSASVPVVSTVTGVITRYVLATFNYTPGPVLEISPGLVTVAADRGGNDPAPQYVDIDNGGTGTLSGLSAGPIDYAAGGTGWLVATLNQTTAPARLTLQAQTGLLDVGTYVARVPIASTVVGTVPDTITVSFGVSATSNPPTIVLSPSTLPISATAGGADPGLQKVSVLNGGGSALTGLGLGSTTYGPGASGWLTSTLVGATAPAVLNLQASTGTLAAGTYTATVRVGSDLSGVFSTTVSVVFTVSGAAVPPVINLSPSNVAFNATAGGADPADFDVDVTNGGGASLALLSLGATAYGPGATGWLTRSLSNTTAPATITLGAAVGALAAGTYTATVPVNSGVAGVASKNLTVSFTVLPVLTAPSIALAPLSRSFTAAQGGANPASSTITVSNNGGGTLSGLAVGTIAYTGGPTGWLVATLNQTTAQATITLQPTTGALAAGSYHATVPVTSGVASNSPRSFTVDFTVTAGANLAISPGSAAFTGTTGQPSPGPKTLNVTNTGGGTISGLAVGAITYGGGQTGWLTANLSKTTTPAALVLTATTGAIPAGNYTADFNVTSSAGSKPVSVTFAVAAGSGSMVILAGDGQTVLVGTQVPTKLRARVYDAVGNPKPGVSVLWQVNNGGTLLNTTNTTDAQGEISTDWKVGPLAGTHTVDLSSAGLPTVTFEADVQLPGNPNAHPNEPGGFVRFAEHNFSSIPTYPKTLGGLAGSWSAYPLNDPDLAIITPDLTAPESPPNILETRFKKGLTGGNAPVNVAGWDAGGTGASKTKLYLSMWVKIKGQDYENHPVITKMGFVAYGQSPANSAANQATFAIAGGPAPTYIGTAFTLQFRQQNILSRNILQNVDRRPLMTVGVWHHWEAVLQLNTLSQSNGIFKMWIDGIKIMDYNDVIYIEPGNASKFYGWKWNPTWGGQGGTRTRDDFIMIDHVYMSGVP